VRQIVLDTETTGLDPSQGHRIIELAGVEMVNRQLTGSRFHHYLNPERDIDPGAQQVHGLSLEFLQDKPRFRDIVAEFIDFIRGAELIIHNAPFDVGFLNRELDLLSLDPIETLCAQITDTLKMAKDLHPGQKNNLDALCRRYQVDNSGRTLHGALLDAELLAEVYLSMTRGQESFRIEAEETRQDRGPQERSGPRPALIVLEASATEREAHQRYLEELHQVTKGGCVWLAGMEGLPQG
jgi:DNA polymerase-3 subunit epsilon